MPDTPIVISNTTPIIHAERLGLSITGTLGVLLKAKQQGLVPEIKPLIEELRQGGIRLERPLVTKTLWLANEES
jgi:predicted nucleic acid-binding protein